MRIIFNNDKGGLSVFTPSPECSLTMEQMGALIVPPGVAYRIVEDSAVPSDYTFRDAWEADMSSPDGVGADYGVGSANDVDGWDESGNPILRGQA